LRLLNGGTDLLIALAKRPQELADVQVVVDIKGIPELREIEAEDAGLRIGGCVTYRQLLESELVQTRAPLLVEACAAIGDPQIRNRGTLAGNLITASPAGDGILALLALDAHIELTSIRGHRVLSVDEFLIGPGATALASDELVSAVRMPATPPHSGSSFRKLGRRKALVIAIASVAVLLTMEDARIKRGAVALGSVAPTAVRTGNVERLLLGEKPSQELFVRASQLAAETARPISDVRSSSAGRLAALTGLLNSALTIASSRVR
jgi:CO/xanthine dehydrogenase FAD-binding subunit